MPTILLCARVADLRGADFEAAASRAGVTLPLITDDVDRPDGAIAVDLARRPASVRIALDALAGTPIDGVLVVSDAAAWLASSIARALEVPLHAPAAVEVAADALLARGRWMAAGLPVPWLVTVPARGDEDLERLTRLRFPCVVRVARLAASRVAIRCDSLDQVMAARTRLAAWLQTEVLRRDTGDDDTLLIEAEVPGTELVLVGTLEFGALRVFALFERVGLAEGEGASDIHVTPARLPPARQQVIAGHIARAAFALGLHHGPLEATCRVDGDDVVVLDVAPRAARGWLAAAVPVVSPDRERCTLADVFLAQACGHSLEHYGHQALSSGVLRVGVAAPGRLVACDVGAAVETSPWVTDVAVAAAPGAAVGPAPEGEPVLRVSAQGAEPDGVVATLVEVASRLRVSVSGSHGPSRSADR